MGKVYIAEQVVAPDTPDAGDHLVYPMDDGTLRGKDSDGVENILGQMLQTTMANMTVPAGYAWMVPSGLTITGTLTVDGEVITV